MTKRSTSQTFTPVSVENLPAVEGRASTDYRDVDKAGQASGLVLRVRADSRVYYVTYSIGGKVTRYRIGPVGEVPQPKGVKPIDGDLARARGWARYVRGLRNSGIDPHAVRIAEAETKRQEEIERQRREERRAAGTDTVGGLVKALLESREAKAWRPKTKDEFERLLKVEVVPVLGTMAVAEVTRGHVRALVERIADGAPDRKAAPFVANRTLQVIKLLFAWAMDRELAQASPAAGLKRPAEEKPRDVEWNDDEVRRIWAALPAAGLTVADEMRLLFYTGARLDEVQGLEWSEVDFARKEWRLPPERSKVGRKKPRSRTIPLVDEAIAILERRKAVKVVDIKRGAFVFPAPRGEGHATRRSKPIKVIKDACGVETFMPHAVRHTLKSRMTRLRVAPHVTEAILGHTIKGIGGVYLGSGVDFLPEMREALETWAGELGRIIADKADKAAGKGKKAAK